MSLVGKDKEYEKCFETSWLKKNETVHMLKFRSLLGTEAKTRNIWVFKILSNLVLINYS